ncbi:MAG: Endopygalactorunase-like protein, partial [Paenibacillus sp.]|nr:Endopygalactorunase-like protein [Paenibacillus sp.]
RGKAKIYVDGVYQTTIDQYNPTIIYRQNVYDTGPLPEGLHTIRVETIWERNPSATTYYVSFDELQVTLPAP